jgi:chromosome segregation ATPase
MKDIAREKYARLMGEIEQIEDLVSEVEGQDSPDKDELEKLRAELAAKKNELTRLSDGCGKPHPTN